MTKKEWEGVPQWKKNQTKKALDLFWVGKVQQTARIFFFYNTRNWRYFNVADC